MKTIAVLGANGRLSHAAACAFYEIGYTVIAITRNGFADNLPAGILHRAADALDADALTEATRGADFIFNGLNPIYTKWAETALPMAKNVIAAAKAHDAIHLFPGNVYNYGKEIGLSMKAQDKGNPSVKKGAIRIEMEALFEQAAADQGVKTRILRAGDFFGGPVEGAWFDLVIASKIKKGVFTYPGPMNLPHAWAYLPDLAKAFVKIAEKSEEMTTFEKFNFEGHTITGEELQEGLENALGHPVKRAGFPWPVLKVGGIFHGMWREIAEMSYLWFTAHSLDSSKLEQIAGDISHTPLNDALAQALKDLNLQENKRKSA